MHSNHVTYWAATTSYNEYERSKTPKDNDHLNDFVCVCVCVCGVGVWTRRPTLAGAIKKN